MVSNRKPAKLAEAPKRKPKRAPAAAKAEAVTGIAKRAAAAVERNRLKGRDALALIQRRTAEMADIFYDIALALGVLRRAEVYAALGAKSFAALIEASGSMSVAAAKELVSIPTYVRRETAVLLRQEKTVAVIRYARASGVDDVDDLVAQDVEIAGLPISKQTARAIDAAASALRATDHGAVPGESEAVESAAALEATLESASGLDLRVVPTYRQKRWWLRTELPADLGTRVRVVRVAASRSKAKRARTH